MVEYKSEDEKLICCFEGRIDTAATMELENELIDKVQHAKCPVIFDFANLEYIASSFLRTCVKAARVVPGHSRLTVVNASENILHILKMTGFDKLMDIKQD